MTAFHQVVVLSKIADSFNLISSQAQNILDGNSNRFWIAAKKRCFSSSIIILIVIWTHLRQKYFIKFTAIKTLLYLFFQLIPSCYYLLPIIGGKFPNFIDKWILSNYTPAHR